MDPSAALNALGFEWPGPAYLVGAVIFGIVGWIAYRHGRRSHNGWTLGLGIALMLYPYAVSSTWLLYVVGIALCAAAYVSARTGG